MQTRSPLRVYHGLNWAYTPRLRKQFCVKKKNITNNRLKTSSRSSFRQAKTKGVVGFKKKLDTRLVSSKSDLQLTLWW